MPAARSLLPLSLDPVPITPGIPITPPAPPGAMALKRLISIFYLRFGSDEGDGKTPSFREGMKSSRIVMY